MNFLEAEQEFKALEKRWSNGELNVDSYRTILNGLQVVNSSGQVWKMQEHTGLWFFLQDGKWIPATEVKPVQAAPGLPAVENSATPSKHRGLKIGVIIALVGLCLLGGAGITTGILAYTGVIPLPENITINLGPSSPEKESAEPGAAVKTLKTTSVSANGEPLADSNGVSLVVPADALEKGDQVNLSSSELTAPWLKEIKKVVSIDTPFYTLAVPGKNDSTGSLSLSFPAANLKSRLLAVIDGNFLVELAQVPENGQLAIQTRAGSTDTTGLTVPDGNGSIYYTVITPNSASSQSPDIQMVGWHPEVDERNCIPDISIIGGATINLCRQNPAGTVQVMLPTAKRDLLPQVDIMVDKIEAVMDKYYKLGFTTAQVSHSSPMLIRVSTKVTSPSYYPLNGVLYIPVDTVTRIATIPPTDLYHEMAHWIQAIKYSTRLAYYSGERTWWLETSAENMVMLIEPNYVGGNLTTYGTISNPDNTLALQSEPYKWPGDYYVQAQLVKVNLCDSPACPLSQANFAKAISEGSYPYMSGSAKGLVSTNLKDYAFYLLGKPPSGANGSIPLSGPVKSGDGYGEYVKITRNNNVDLKYNYNGTDPQMRKETKDGKETLAIDAKLQKDGVYPLMILGGDGNNPGLPVEMVIEPGASFYYTQDDGELKYSDGSQELKLLPIHGKMGIKKVRLVAMGINGGEVFKARVEPLSLEGAWVVLASGPKTSGAMQCSKETGGVDNPDGTAQIMAYFISIAGGTGDMKADPTGRNLDWSEIASRVPAQFNEANVTFKATTLLAGDAIQYQANIDIPKSDETSSLPPSIPMAAALSIPVFWLGRKRLNIKVLRVFVNMFVIVFLVLVSTGCFGIGMYGSATVDAKFKKVEYIGGEDTGVLTVSDKISGLPQGKPIWKLTGTGTYDVTFMIETTVTDSKGADKTEIDTCTGVVAFPVTAFIYKDFQVVMPGK
jgi:hypothetical protein